MAISKKTVVVCTCDICKKTTNDEKRIRSVQIPVTFLTEQTEGRAVAPYISIQNLDLCATCLKKVAILTATGAQGYNTYRFNENVQELKDAEQEIKRLKGILEANSLPLNPCDDCGKEECNPGLSVCGPCYHERITGNH